MDNTIIFIADDSLGHGDDELGRALMLAAIKNLAKSGGAQPSHIILMNQGVTLCCTGSNALDDLRGLGAAGVELL